MPCLHQKNMVLWLVEHLGHALPYRSERRLTLACTHFFMEIYVDELSNRTGYSGRAEKRKQSDWEGTGSHYLRHLSFADRCILMIEAIVGKRIAEVTTKKSSIVNSRTLRVGLDGVGQNTPTILYLSLNKHNITWVLCILMAAACLKEEFLQAAEFL